MSYLVVYFEAFYNVNFLLKCFIVVRLFNFIGVKSAIIHVTNFVKFAEASFVMQDIFKAIPLFSKGVYILHLSGADFDRWMDK